MKRHCSSSFDRISELPCHIIETILMFLPLEDMGRTSVLSRNWRFLWTRVPQLIFDPCKRYTATRVFEILLLHEGPIFKFTLNMKGWHENSQINDVIELLSRSGIQDLRITMNDEYTLPSTIFSWVQLKHLSVKRCVFQPLTFDGFSKLITLELLKVELESYVSISSCPLLESLTMKIVTTVAHFSVDAPKLKLLSFQGDISYIGFMNTPLLKDLSFSRDDADPDLKFTNGLMKLLCSLPHLENLVLYYTFMNLLVSDVSPNKLPTALGSLRKLELVFVSLDDKKELSSTLWLMRNSPNLLKLKFEQPLTSSSKFELGLRKQDYFVYNLMKLKELEMVFYESPDYVRPLIEFMKFLLDVTPDLEKLYIGPYPGDLDESQQKMVLQLRCYPCASPKAEVVLCE